MPKEFFNNSIYSKELITRSENITFTKESSFNVMKRAAKACYNFISQNYSVCKVLVICGPGNNGGDGLLIAQMLSKEGYSVNVYFPLGVSKTKDASIAYDSLNKDLVIKAINNLSEYKLIIDALFGFNFNKPLNERTQLLINSFNKTSAVKIAIDVPSGIYCDTGKIDKIAFKANRTLALHRLKPCHVLLPGKEYSGQITLLDIKVANLDKDNSVELIERPTLKLPTLQMHKYSRGELLIIASREMFGASKLTTLAASQTAFKSGAGIVKLLVHENDIDIYKHHVLEEILLAYKTLSELKLLIKHNSTIVFGCGLKNTKFNQDILNYILTKKVSIVFDAGAFSIMSNNKENFKKLLRNHKGQKVLTPHFGEFSKVFQISDNKIDDCLKAAEETDSVVLLKGSDTVIANKNGNIKINYFTSPFLATAGTGDILAGLIGSFLTQGYSAFQAARYGCYIHSQSALKLDRNFVASELTHEIPFLVRKLSK